MRDFADTDSQTIGRDVLRRKIQHFADRIKVAVAEMETTTATCKESLQVGNAAKMREALERSTTRLKGIADCFPEIRHLMQDQIEENEAALAEPLRNCDVGTEEEQETRFTEFCDAHKYVGDDGANWCSRDCPFYNKIDCGVWWAQMPYESEVK